MSKTYKMVYAFLFGITMSGSLTAQMAYVNSEWVSQTPVVGDGIYHSSSITVSNKLIVTSKVLNGSGNSDIATIKYNNNGDTLWMKTYNGSANLDDYGIELAATSGGDIVVAGTAQNTSGGYDYKILRYHGTTGALQWSYTWNGATSGTDIPTDIVIDGSDNIYVTGGTETASGFSDYATIKLSSSGSFQWASYYDYANLHDAASNVKIGGSHVIVNGASAAAVGDWDLATVKLNPTTGAIATSHRTAGGATIVEATSMTTDADNNVYITGYAEVSGNKNIQTLKLDSDLDLVWVADYVGSFDDIGNDIEVDTAGNVYVTGFSKRNAEQSEAITIKYNSSGTQQWSHKYGITYKYSGAVSEKIKVTKSGNVYITGTIDDSQGTGSFFFSKYNTNGDLLLTSFYQSDGVDNSAYDITIDADTIYITGLSDTTTSSQTTIVKYTLLANVEPHYFYLDDKKYQWCQQPGMYSFMMADSSEYSGTIDSTIVEEMEYFPDGAHYIFFKEDADSADIFSTISTIESANGFKKEYMVAMLTSNNTSPYSKKLYGGLDDFIEVVFTDTNITSAEIDSFEVDFGMTLFHSPPSNITGGVYIFQVDSTPDPAITIKKSADIWEDDPTFVKKVNPSMRVFRPDDPNDPLYSDMWYAENDGTGTCNGGPWVTDADIELDRAWNLGNEFGYGVNWSGNGVNVGVIDFHGYEYDHPDMDEVFRTGYVLPSAGTEGGITFDNTLIVGWPDVAHGQNVSGIIAANAQNEEGGAGVAFNSKITPCLMLGGTTAALISGLQILSWDELEISVINMSLGMNAEAWPDAEAFAIHTTTQNTFTQTRPDPSDPTNKRGIVLVASSGNTEGEFYNIPSIYVEVLGVGATNPSDQVKSTTDGYGATWGSSYTPQLDVSAPGVCINSTDYVGTDGYDATDYNSFAGTSAAAPIVSGIAALIVEKNDEIGAWEIYNNIKWSCEKVGGYTYTIPGPYGRCTELGFGRVNAFQALGWTPASEIEELNGIDYYYNNPSEDLLRLTVNGVSNYSVQIIDLSGKILINDIITDRTYSEYDLSSLSAGFYLIRIEDINKNEVTTGKLIKR